MGVEGRGENIRICTKVDSSSPNHPIVTGLVISGSPEGIDLLIRFITGVLMRSVGNDVYIAE